MTQHQLVTVDFQGQSIVAIVHDGKPHVALRPIVENIGLDWAAQYTRINRHHILKSTVVVMTTVGEDGKQREMLCLPLSMLNGWLFGVDVNRVREEIRPKLIRYQRECFEVLAQHFMPAQRPHNPAIDYDRISPAQAQDLKELVHSIAESKVQGFGETWARLHRKFRVNSYLELPATRFTEARDYLLGKLPAEPLTLPAPADRLELAFSLAAQASAQVQRTVFAAVLAGGDEWQHSRYLLALTHDRRTNTTTEPWAKALAHDAMVVSMDELPTRLTAADPLPASDLQLARLSAACAQRMERRAQQRATHSTPQLRA